MNNLVYKRLDLLEQRLIPRAIPCVVFTMHALSPEEKQNLQPGERIVSDEYRQTGLLIYAAQRVTTDPNDHGRPCGPEGYLEDVVRRIHESCEERHKSGSCNACHGTRIANT